MAVNERIEHTFTDINYQQKAQTGRTSFTPGKATSRAGDENWPTDINIPVPNAAIQPSGSVEMLRARVLKIGRGIICDQVIDAPITSTPIEDGETGTGYSGTYILTPTNTQNNNGSQEKKTGGDRPNL